MWKLFANLVCWPKRTKKFRITLLTPVSVLYMAENVRGKS